MKCPLVPQPMYGWAIHDSALTYNDVELVKA